MSTGVKYLSLAVLYTVVMLLTGCGGSNLAPVDGTGLEQPASGQPGGWPGFPEPQADVQPAHRVSDTQYSVAGADFISARGELNRFGPAGSYILVSSSTDLAWAYYGVPELTGDRPVSLTLNVEAAELTPGGGEFLPVHYWIGVADQSTHDWLWFDDLSASETVTLNSTDLRDRFVDADGTLIYIVVVPPTGDGGGNFACQVNTGIVTTSPGYLQNKPRYVMIDDLGSAQGSVHLAWTHVAAFGAWDELNAADEYEVYRRESTAADWELIGSVSAPTATYTDPLDNDSGVADPIPGRHYAYGICAVNEAGATPRLVRSLWVQLVPPTDVSASDGDYEDMIVVSWTPAAGATGYEIFRNDGGNWPVWAVTGEVTSWEDHSMLPHLEYTYWVRSTYGEMNSEPSLSDTGYAGTLLPPLDPPTDVSATDGSYADRVVLSWTSAVNAIGYAIYRDIKSGEPWITVGDVNSWEDLDVEPGRIYTYWVRSLQTEYQSILSESDTGHSSTTPDLQTLQSFPTDCYPDNEILTIVYADPVVRRNPFIADDIIANQDVLKTNGQEFTVSPGWPRIAVVQTDDPATITSLSQGIAYVNILLACPHRLDVDIMAITPTGLPGDPLLYSYRIFNHDGSSPGGGTFLVHPVGAVDVGVTGVDWAIDVWDREALEIGDRQYTNRLLDGSTLVGDATPPVFWFEYTGGYYFDRPDEFDGVYSSPAGAGTDNLLIRILSTANSKQMFLSQVPVIAGVDAQGSVIAIWTPTVSAFTNPSIPGWPGIFDSGGTYEIALEVIQTPGIEYTYPDTLTVIGINPNL